LSQKIHSSGWHPEPGNLSQNGLNLPHLQCHSQKKQCPKL